MAEKKKTKNTQEEIEAALAAATGSTMNPPIPKGKRENPELGSEQPPNVEPTNVEPKKPEEAWYSKENLENAETTKGETPPQDSGVDMSQEDFGRKCYYLDIDAKMCNRQSSKTKDKGIDEFLRGINKKIFEETKVGGYSTNVQFRVAPNDYVNVNHILDWYRVRGFQILNYSLGTSPYGNGAGMMEHSFTISWAEV